MADIFQTWKEGDLDSYPDRDHERLPLRKTDASTGKPLVDVIVDEAEQKGTGRWTAQNALDLACR
jgi:6-phosphogluconate dehydrogenase